MLADLRGQHVLIDTCVLINSLMKKDSGLVSLMADLVGRNNNLCINDAIEIELLRSAKGASEVLKISSFISDHFVTLPVTRETIKLTKELYPLYNFCNSVRNKNQISVVDAINAAQLMQFSHPIFLLTLDNSDYPIELITRNDVGAIDIGESILTWGLYSFNHKKCAGLKKNFSDR